MIFSSIHAKQQSVMLPTAVEKALDFLKAHDFTKMEPGRYAIQGDDRDLIFYKKVENECFIEARPGCYSVFFPEDIHRPACASGQPMTVRKVVVKISVKLL